MSDLALIQEKLARLIPRLASDADGEVLATVAAIRRVLAGAGLDLHDLAATLQSPALSEPTPADLAQACTASGQAWKPHELDFLNNVMRFGSAWNALTGKQAGWLHDLHRRACWRAAA